MFTDHIRSTVWPLRSVVELVQDELSDVVEDNGIH